MGCKGKTHDGPLALARDLMVISVTKETINLSKASVDEYVLAPDVTQAYKDAPRTDDKSPSKFFLDGERKDYTPPPMPQKPWREDHLERTWRRALSDGSYP